MAKTRLELHEFLVGILGDKTRHVYFQPPTNTKISYPAIIYSLSDLDDRQANNNLYKREKAYQVIVVDKNPDSEIFERMSKCQYCRFDRFYTSDNLNHFVFTLYY
jgi:hypothetical protein